MTDEELAWLCRFVELVAEAGILSAEEWEENMTWIRRTGQTLRNHDYHPSPEQAADIFIASIRETMSEESPFSTQ